MLSNRRDTFSLRLSLLSFGFSWLQDSKIEVMQAKVHFSRFD